MLGEDGVHERIERAMKGRGAGWEQGRLAVPARIGLVEVDGDVERVANGLAVGVVDNHRQRVEIAVVDEMFPHGEGAETLADFCHLGQFDPGCFILQTGMLSFEVEGISEGLVGSCCSHMGIKASSIRVRTSFSRGSVQMVEQVGLMLCRRM